MTITIDEIKAAHDKVAEMISAFELQGKWRELSLAAMSILLAAGEEYAGIMLGEDGLPSHHVILLPGETTGTWEDAKKWAEQAGGELPTRREQPLLFANLKGSFESAWYWSGEQYSALYAWLQYFDDGFQGYNAKGTTGRARAVRRIYFNPSSL